MLTPLENVIFDRMLIFCCNYFGISVPFSWENRRIYLKIKLSNWNRLYNFIIWFSVILTLSFRIAKCQEFLAGRNRREYLGLILVGCYFLQDFAHLIMKLNILKYQNEFIWLINQVQYVNSCWGKLHIFSCFLFD